MIEPTINIIDSQTLEVSNFTSQDSQIISSYNLNSLFDSKQDNIEYHIYDNQGSLLSSNINFTNFTPHTINSDNSTIDSINLDPATTVKEAGFNKGKYKIIYNFISPKFGTTNSFFIKDISSDRTEIRIQNNNLINSDLEFLFNKFKDELVNDVYFDEFYINFGSNKLYIGVNALLDKLTQNYTILIKLYKPLPSNINVKDILSIVTKPGESVAYSVDFPQVPINIDNRVFLQGPNTNILLNDKVGSSNLYLNNNDIINSPSSHSFNQLQSVLIEKGIELNTDYTDYTNFVFFGNVEQRFINFYNKISDIEIYKNDLNVLTNITGSTSSSLTISSSKATINSSITDIITKFDGFEYYLYFESSSYAWPKSNSTYPYNLYSTGSSNALTWYGSSNTNSPYYGGQIYSASIYDNQNQNQLIYTIPDFIKSDSTNNQYMLFISMMGQFFDNIWLYTKAITDKMDSDNRINYGISADLVAEVLKSFGQKIYSNQFSLNDLYSSFLGSTQSGSLLVFPDTTGSLPTPTGYEYINNYITGSSNILPLDEANKKLYKRLYHNLPYLLKKKGTIEGIRSIGNIYGIPDTVLRINEFGGKNKTLNDWDQWQEIFNYAFYTSGSSFIDIPWVKLKPNNKEPYNIEFRFKTPGINSAINNPSQSLLAIKQDATFGGIYISTTLSGSIVLEYSGSGNTSGSYSGSIVNPYNTYGTLKWIDPGNNKSASIYLPFFDGGWWTVALNLSSSLGSSSLYVKNNIYEGDDGNQLGFQSSASIPYSGMLHLGLNLTASLGTGSISYGGKTYRTFTGSFQEFRYYNTLLSESIINNYVMNPLSIEGNSSTGPGSSFNSLLFRAPLGAVLDNNILITARTSSHPSITGSSNSLVTQSFYTNNSIYTINPPTSTNNWNFVPNIETAFLDSPNVGLRNVVNNKIQVVTGSIYGNVLSQYISLEQNPELSQSYSPNINLLEVIFSPQSEIDNDIINTLNQNSISEALADPRQISESSNRYSSLDTLSNEYFQKYKNKYNIKDYLRIIKYFDNSLFKLIKDYTPARTDLTTGILIKSHLLERNRIKPVVIEQTENYNFYSGSIINKDETSGSIYNYDLGGAGGSINKYNITSSNLIYPPGTIAVTQSYTQSIQTLSGLRTFINDYQLEFFNGEYSGSNINVSTQSLNPNNVFLQTPIVDISTSVSKSFLNSEFNPLINNILNNAINPYQIQIDYTTSSGSIYPSNKSIITSFNTDGGNDTTKVAIQANLNDTQESNYTTKAIINARYEGCDISSVDYNNYTSSGSFNGSFIDGSTGDWGGDNSYGKTAVIDKYPQYIAHFSYSNENKELPNTFTYNIDKLIYIPNRILTDNEKNNPSVLGKNDLDINGSNKFLYETSNIFEKNRNCEIIYNQLTSGSIDFNSITIPFDNNLINPNTLFSNIALKKYNINQGGIEYDVLYTNIKNYNNINVNNGYSTSSLFIKNNNKETASDHTCSLATGSNMFILSGSFQGYPDGGVYMGNSVYGSGTPILGGPTLAILHTYNVNLSNKIFGINSGSSDKRLFINTIDSTNINNYHIFRASQSLMSEYKETQTPFLIRPGDIITINYSNVSKATSLSNYGVSNIITQDFTVTSVPSHSYVGQITTPYTLQSGSSNVQTNFIASNIYDQINVIPNPQDFSIYDGMILSFTIKRRTQKDNKVILDINPPQGTYGILTPSGDGYLIPSDLSQIQRDNVSIRIKK